jgi:hemerythrin superfamily protein
MEATQLLKKDHDAVRSLAERFRTASEDGDVDKTRQIAEEICSELDVHAEIEESIFYPRIRDLDVDELTDLVAESIEEHHVVKVLIKEIRGLADSSDDKLVAKTTVLIENAEHHASEEEDEMFPKVREQMTPQELEAMGEELEQAKQSA